MKRGFTKPFSRGRVGQQQREEARRVRSVNWHLKHGNFELALKNLEHITEGRGALRQFITKRLLEQRRDEHG